MTRTERHIVIDVGNTAAKIGVFADGDPVAVEHTVVGELVERVGRLSDEGCTAGIVSTVVDLSEDIRNSLCALPIGLTWLGSDTPLPFVNLYHTPETLGPDRLAAVAGAMAICPGRDVLVIDAGTCIKYEWLTADGRYHGGNIAPGLAMRFRALHDYTARLPLISADGQWTDIGVDTRSAMRAGVVGGIGHEMNGLIHKMAAAHADMQVIVTGGDADTLLPLLERSAIHAPNLVLLGLHHILRHCLCTDKQATGARVFVK